MTEPTVTDAVAEAKLFGLDDPPTDPPKNRGGRPRKSPSSPAKSPARGGRPSKEDELTKRLAEQLTAIGMVTAALTPMTGNPAFTADAITIANHSEPVAEALVKASKNSPQLRRFLESGMETAGWLGVVIAVGAMSLEIAGNHGIGITPTIDTGSAETLGADVPLPFGKTSPA